MQAVRNQSVKIGLVQMQCSVSREENLNHALELIGTAASQEAKIVCLPELFLSTYFCQKKGDGEAFLKAETIPGEATEALSRAAAQHHIVLVGGSLFEKDVIGKYFNTATVFDEMGTLLGKYRKMHIPEDPRFFEQYYFSPGDTGINVFETCAGRIAPLICYDQWFPEAARIATLQGAQIILYPTAIGHFTDENSEEGDWQKSWEVVQRGHAIANNVYIAAVNRVGREDYLDFWGGSFVCDPFGKVIARAGREEEILLAELDLAYAERLKNQWGFFQNRRPSEYGGLLSPS